MRNTQAIQAEIEKYTLMLYPSASITPNEVIGRVYVNDDKENYVIDIVWDNQFVLNARSTMLVTSTMNENSYLTIYVSDLFAENLHEKEEYISALWHEIGHIHYGHFDLDSTQEEQRYIRYESIMKGDASIYEKEADYFAVLCCGKNRTIRFLETLKRLRSKSDANYEMAIREFDARIRSIKKINL